MVREGCFDDVDFAYAWHPMFETGIMNKTLANVRVIYDLQEKVHMQQLVLRMEGVLLMHASL